MSPGRTTVLVVDDEQSLREFIRRNLEVRNFEVLTAANGLEGMALFGTEQVDLLIVDLMLPHMNGLEMIRRTGVEGVTVARGAIGNPWIFGQARALAEGRPLPPAPRLPEQREVMREHYRLAEQLYGEKRCPLLMRKFGIKYAASHPRHEDVRAALVRVRSRQDWHAVLDRWYAEDLPGCYPPRELHGGQNGCEQTARAEA